MVCFQFVTVEDVRILRDIGNEFIYKTICLVLTSCFIPPEQFYSTQIVCSVPLCCCFASDGLRAGRDAGERRGADLRSALCNYVLYLLSFCAVAKVGLYCMLNRLILNNERVCT